MLSQEQIETYNRDGFIVVEDVFSPDEVAELRAVTDDFVEKSRQVSEHDNVYDLEPTHSASEPRVRRIKTPHLHHDAYRRAVNHPGVLEVLKPLIGDAIKFDESKLNMKAAGYGSAVEWHQDWAFYPATNDDLCAVGIMLDDCAMENGPLLILPGSHQGPVYDHHADGRFCGAIDGVNSGIDFSKAQPCLGRAGSISVHHVRAVHGSAPNVSDRMRRLFLLQYRAADAWPLVPPEFGGGGISFEEFQRSSLICGEYDPIVARMTEVPVRLPLPGAEHVGSIFEKQRGLKNSYFGAAPAGVAQTG